MPRQNPTLLDPRAPAPRGGAPRRPRFRAGLRTFAMAAWLGLGAAALAQPPECRVDDLPARVLPAGDGSLTRLDTARRLPRSFAPGDLVPLTRAGFEDARRVRAVIVDDLAALRRAALEAGHALEVQSAYRSFAYQERTFAHWVEVGGYEHALSTSARAGHSEHQLGTTVDLRSAGGPAPWTLQDWADTPAGAWVAANAWRFGFVVSYPRGERERTCYTYEPWHLRWVGRALAAEVARSDAPLRVHLWERSRAP